MSPTIPQTMQRLLEVHHELDAAQRYLRECRLDEVAKVEAYRKAKAMAHVHSDCPAVERGRVTVGERDAWVDRHVEAVRIAAKTAEAIRESAADHLRVVRDQASLVQSSSALIRAELSLSAPPNAA